MTADFENYLAARLIEELDSELPESEFEGILSDAIELAAADYEEEEGEDCTDYAHVARLATETWSDRCYDALCEQGEHLAALQAGY